MIRNIALDRLKLILALMVVGIHGQVFIDVSPVSSWLTVNGLFRIAVPIFLLINGYFLAAIIDDPEARRRWFVRILSLYVIWMAIYAPMWMSQAGSMGKAVYFVAIGWLHLWYVIGLLCAGLLLVLTRRWGSRFVAVSALFLFLVGVAIQYAGIYDLVGGLAGTVADKFGAHRNFLFLAYPLLACGYLIRRHDWDGLINMQQAIWLTACGLVLLLVESGLIYWTAPETAAVDNYISVGLAAPAIFLMAKQIKIEGRFGKETSLLANGIYFIHPLLLVGMGINDAMTATAATVVTIALSTVVAWGMVKLSVIRKWLL
ncbi:acyltransferase family protein [Parvularcula sp. LCG005]|uniref:acyltransferase family protein n=1 Tax=Parvularcula sp. LCG005 TaxID=3078805 RepID=UPI0029424830|nr:acyltransferase family protein [Parvularcula sp. LCG005]WOI53332.1 acyltransferase family protein [Parvularcula sp. LCG005]